MKLKNNTKEFRILYNKLDEVMSSRIDTFQRKSFVQKLKKFSDIYPSFQNLKGEIRMIHDLRNLIIHEEKYKQEIAIPTESLLKRIKEIIKKIEKPQKAIDIASKDVYRCGLDDKVLDIVRIMAQNVYSQVPVFQKKDSTKDFVGVLTESSVINQLVKSESISSATEVKDMIDVITSPVKEGWEFVAWDEDVFKVIELFQTKSYDNAKLKKAKLGVLFVTENGMQDEEIKGIITSWDLSKVNR